MNNIYILTIFPFNQLAIYVFLVLLLWCWFITNMAAKGLVEQLCRCLLFFYFKAFTLRLKGYPGSQYFQCFLCFRKRKLKYAWTIPSLLSKRPLTSNLKSLNLNSPYKCWYEKVIKNKHMINMYYYTRWKTQWQFTLQSLMNA